LNAMNLGRALFDAMKLARPERGYQAPGGAILIMSDGFSPDAHLHDLSA